MICSLPLFQFLSWGTHLISLKSGKAFPISIIPMNPPLVRSVSYSLWCISVVVFFSIFLHFFLPTETRVMSTNSSIYCLHYKPDTRYEHSICLKPVWIQHHHFEKQLEVKIHAFSASCMKLFNVGICTGLADSNWLITRSLAATCELETVSAQVERLSIAFTVRFNGYAHVSFMEAQSAGHQRGRTAQC